MAEQGEVEETVLKDTVQDIIYYDFETGGTSSKKNPATEVYFSAVKGDNFTEIANLHIVFLPYDDKLIYDEKALRITNISMEYIMENGIPMKDALEKIFAFFTKVKGGKGAGFKPILSAHNGKFDRNFLQQIFSYGKYKLEDVLYGDKDHFGNFQPEYLDSLTLARQCWNNDPEVPSVALAKVAELLDVQLVGAHRSEADVAILREICTKFIQRLRGVGAGSSAVKSRLRDSEQFKI